MLDISSSFSKALDLLFKLDIELFAIVMLSLQVSLTAVLLAFFVGAPLGGLLAVHRFKYRVIIMGFANTFLALPPVVVGLLVYLMLSKSGFLGELNWLFTPQAMVLAQFILCLPIIIALTLKMIEPLWQTFGDNLRVDGAGTLVSLQTLFEIAKAQLLTVFLTAFGRAIAEVGAIMMVGGNIRGSTRTMTTAIALETSKGDFSLALALGVILLSVALLINMIITFYSEKTTGHL